jgi:hypothetical protein
VAKLLIRNTTQHKNARTQPQHNSAMDDDGGARPTAHGSTSSHIGLQVPFKGGGTKIRYRSGYLEL